MIRITKSHNSIWLNSLRGLKWAFLLTLDQILMIMSINCKVEEQENKEQAKSYNEIAVEKAQEPRSKNMKNKEQISEII